MNDEEALAGSFAMQAGLLSGLGKTGIRSVAQNAVGMGLGTALYGGLPEEDETFGFTKRGALGGLGAGAGHGALIANQKMPALMRYLAKNGYSNPRVKALLYGTGTLAGAAGGSLSGGVTGGIADLLRY